jgi:hypothetical protein
MISNKDKNSPLCNVEKQIKPMITQTDYALWLDNTISLLQRKKYDSELRNRLTTMLEHCLKLYYSNYNLDYRGWSETIKRSQRELKELLEESPSLKQYWDEIFLDCYSKALESLRENRDYQSFPFPDNCPFSQEISRILTQSFYRES